MYVRYSLHVVNCGQLLCCAYKRFVNIMKVYIERNNLQVELILFRKNIDFIDVGNFEVGIYFRDRRVYETRLIAIRDVSPQFCVGSSQGKSVQAPIRLHFVTLQPVSECLDRLATASERNGHYP